MENKEKQSIKQLSKILKGTEKQPQDILKECFKRAGVEMPKYISYISKIDLLDIIHQNDRLTFNLKSMESLQDLKVYLIEHQGLIKIGIYDQKKDKFIIEKNSFISKENIKIKGYLVRIENNNRSDD